MTLRYGQIVGLVACVGTGGSLSLGYSDRRSFRIVKAIHGLQTHNHVQPIGQDEDKEQRGDEPHPDARREEASTVAGVGKLEAGDIEALDLEFGDVEIPLCSGRVSAAVIDQDWTKCGKTADILAVEGIDAGHACLGSDECSIVSLVKYLYAVQSGPIAS